MNLRQALIDTAKHEGKTQPPCRPFLVIVPPGLLSQTVRELHRFSKKFRIFLYHGTGEAVAKDLQYVRSCDNTLKKGDKELDPSRSDTNWNVFVSSYPTLTARHGPLRAHKERQSRLSDTHEEKGRKFDHTHYSEPGTDASFSLEGVMEMVFTDEATDIKGNSTYAKTVLWLKTKVVMFTATPAQSSINDYQGYLKFVELPHIVKAVEVGDRMHNYLPPTDPWARDASDLHHQFRYCNLAWDKWITKGKQAPMTTPDGVVYPNLEYAEKNARRQDVLGHFMIRRNYDSSLPFNHPERAIAKNLPEYNQYTFNVVFSPTAQVLHDRFATHFMNKLYHPINDAKTSSGNAQVKPNPMMFRALTLISFIPLLGYLHDPRDDEKSDKGTKRKYFGWFHVDSELYQDMPVFKKKKCGIAMWLAMRLHEKVRHRAHGLFCRVSQKAPLLTLCSVEKVVPTSNISSTTTAYQ